MLSLHALAFMGGMCDSEICYVVLCAIVANSCALLDSKFNKVKCAILELITMLISSAIPPAC